MTDDTQQLSEKETRGFKLMRNACRLLIGAGWTLDRLHQALRIGFEQAQRDMTARKPANQDNSEGEHGSH